MTASLEMPEVIKRKFYKILQPVLMKPEPAGEQEYFARWFLYTQPKDCWDFRSSGSLNNAR